MSVDGIDDRVDQAIRSYDTPDPPDGLAERVTRNILAGAAAGALGRRPWGQALAAAGLLAAGAAGATLWLTFRPLDDRPVTAGERAAVERETVNLGRQAVAVLEPGASVRWQPGAGGALAVEQPRGQVFYRVESGPFEVVTPGGTVKVRGTCFRVEVPDMKLTADKLKGAAAGAALASAVLVTVYEGQVTFANRAGETQLAAGQTASTTGGEAPVLSPLAERPGAEATRLALATAALERVPRLSAEPVPPQPAPAARSTGELEELPAPLRAVLRQVAQGRPMDNLKIRPHGRDDRPVYNLDFDIDGINHELDVDAEGKVLKSEVDLPLSVLPPVITSSVQAAYPDATLVDAELNQNEGMPRYYEIHIRRDGRLIELQILDDGRIARELRGDDCPHQGR
jgi:ferric-dicitrate binding protein FerR (iron transport regulator)